MKDLNLATSTLSARALKLENIRIDNLGIVKPGCYLKLPDTRSTSIFDLPLDLKP